MPCDSSHLEPTRREREMQEAGQLLCYIHDINNTQAPQWARTAAEHCYGQALLVPGDFDSGYVDVIAELCETLRAMDESKREELLYGDARCKMRRTLANWWERHLEDDRNRERLEQQRANREALRESAIEKLTPEERDSLGL